MTECRKKLTRLWFGLSGFLFIILILQTILDHYGQEATEVWGWFLPMVLPTLSLIIGVVVVEFSERKKVNRYADRFLFRLSFLLSAIYLTIIALLIFLQPFLERPPLEIMKQSNLWLGPFQGLVSAAIGAFFTKQQCQ